uniref:Fibronectin type-II domain-containing protein n=1 Tax=Guillardia theta TaxID=55529 RepID=A0A7S4UKH1_GUITH|mmetsp:Transcript_6920/g.24237  ORF Transcript_6920/g.24237 Transcript_6920/m.24237 type:complete len:595 (+) Transcript_6920:39-1823(+)
MGGKIGKLLLASTLLPGFAGMTCWASDQRRGNAVILSRDYERLETLGAQGSLMRGHEVTGKARWLGGWRLAAGVSYEVLPETGSMRVTCSRESGCGTDFSREDRQREIWSWQGLVMMNVTLPGDVPYILKVYGSAPEHRKVGASAGHPEPFLACPIVVSESKKVVGKHSPASMVLVGGCQSPLSEDGSFVSTSAFRTQQGLFTRFHVGVLFNDRAKQGDSFTVVDMILQVVFAFQPENIQIEPKKFYEDSNLLSEAARGERNEPIDKQYIELLAGSFACPDIISLTRRQVEVQEMYDGLVTRLRGTTRPLHFYSFYGRTSSHDWDQIVRMHVGNLGYKRGDRVFEAGCAAGAFLESIARQYGSYVAGVDIAGALINIARSRVPGHFCVAPAQNLSFIRRETFDHSLSFGVLTYAEHAIQACEVARELVRVTKPGGTIFLGQLNDPDMAPYRPEQMQGSTGVPPDLWFKFALALDLEVDVARGEEVYSRRVIPDLEHYDLHAYYRYNVYLRKRREQETGRRGRPLDVDCGAFRSERSMERYTVDGRGCAIPFRYRNVLFDDCTLVERGVGEWCCTDQECNTTNWRECAPVYRRQA